MRSTPYRNVIVFGESGVGKSSVINMVVGQDVAATSSDAMGCTFGSYAYAVEISGSNFQLFDTAGLNEATTVKPKDALTNLYKLVQSLRDGVSLLVYVVRGPRVKEFTVKNYKLFYDIFCQKSVPIVLVVTGLELEASMDEWWDRNARVFSQHGMQFSGQACITATKGKERKGVFMFEDEYEESRMKVADLILKNSRATPWKMDPTMWLTVVVKKMWNSFATMFNWPLATYSRSLYQALIQIGGFSEKEARDMSNRIVEGLQEGLQK